MIKLYQFPAHWGLPNVSPYCLKLETYLRMAKLPYEVVPTSDPRKSPKGKLPCIVDDGYKISDSGLIIDYLKKKYGDTLDASLSQQQKAQAIALQRLIEEHLSWTMLYARWIEPDNWLRVKDEFFSKLPVIPRFIISTLMHKKVVRDLQGHGMGRHSRDEIYQMGINDLAVLSVTLGDHPYLMGDQPTSIDACGYGFIANILYVPIPSPLQDYAKSQKNLGDYAERMRKAFYP